MQIKFIGVPGEDHKVLTMYGYTFPLDQFVNVTNSAAIEVLRDHPHFESKATEAEDVVIIKEKPKTGSLEEFLAGTVAEIKGKLADLSDEQLKDVAEGEKAGKDRAGVLDAVAAEQDARAKKD